MFEGCRANVKSTKFEHPKLRKNYLLLHICHYSSQLSSQHGFAARVPDLSYPSSPSSLCYTACTPQALYCCHSLLLGAVVFEVLNGFVAVGRDVPILLALECNVAAAVRP